MNIELTALEARVIGCLIEKAITTPDQYPLSLNALANACNQKSNRDPIMDLDERTVQQTVDGLVRKHLILEKSGFGSRVPKYQHRFCNTGFGAPSFTPLETAIVCELMLRGPQTPGELKTRTARMAESNEVSEIESALLNLATRQDGPYVVQLPRESGRRDSRYAHLLSGDIDMEAIETAAASAPEPKPRPQNDRIERLEELVEELRRELNELKEKLGD
ncbi:MAG: YceH family protein [Povalibacter sp.]